MKYLILILNVIGLLILCSVTTLWLPSALPVQRPLPDTAPVDTKLADQKALEETRHALATLEQLNLDIGPASAAIGGESNESSTAHLIAQPAMGQTAMVNTRTDETETTILTPSHHLTLLLETQSGRSAVIDDRLVHEGDRLPGGNQILKLARDHVVIKGPQGRKTLRLPLEQLRIGKITVATDAISLSGNLPLTGSIAVPPLIPAGNQP